MNCFSQDTIQWNDPPDGWFWIDEYHPETNGWTRQEFIDSVLFSVEELDTTKFYTTGNYTGYYQNGTIAFFAEHFFNGEKSEKHGVKKVFHPNGKLKEQGQYFHSIKTGRWMFFSEDGDTLKTTDYDAPLIDTITNPTFLMDPPISSDIISLTLHHFTADWPIIDFGKNGLEVVYENNIPVEAVLYEFGEIIRSEKNPKRMKKLLKNNEHHHTQE